MVEYLSDDHLVHRMLATNSTTINTGNYYKKAIIPKPKLTIKKVENGVYINFSNFEGDTIKIYSKRSSEDNFSLLAEVNTSQYLDDRPNLFGAPELREYMAYYTKDKKQLDIPSDVVLIIKK